jgi:hypothetical protein
VKSEDVLLSREEFRTAVFARDAGQCLVCPRPAVDAHHIIERRLFPDGGYYLGNGAAVCEEHHLAAEATTLSCQELREKAGIQKIILPGHLYQDQEWDKWGNPILPNGQRLKGELFHDESVQKVIAPVLHLFTTKVKYPRTFHLPWSPNVGSDDKVMESLAWFQGEEVVVTVKMDGEQTSLYRDGFHARSLDTPSHPSRDWLWGLHRQVGHDIPEGWRITGENLYAMHSIHYRNLKAAFMAFGMWDEKNLCLSWDDTELYAATLGLKTVDVLYRGIWNEAVVKALEVPSHNGDPCEGYVCRVSRAFAFKEFKSVVGKSVRKDHVHTHGHWMREAVVPNLVRQG